MWSARRIASGRSRTLRKPRVERLTLCVGAFADGRELRVDAALSAANRQPALAAGWVGTVLVQLDMGTIDVSQLTFGPLRHPCQHPAKQTRLARAAKPCVDRTPWKAPGGRLLRSKRKIPRPVRAR